MNNNDEFFRMKEIVAKRKAENELRYKQQSKDRLRRNILTKQKTTMIGALAIFEKYFGELWGHNNDGRPLTVEERDFKNTWEQARAEILDKGNANIRALEDELSNYTCEWNRYKSEFIIKKDIRSDNNG
jgi:hypothetical protein